MAVALQGVAALLVVMAVGWWLAGRPWFGDKGQDIFSKYASQVAIPCYVLANVYTTVESQADLLRVFQNLPAPLLAIGASFVLAWLLAALLRVAPGRRGVFINAVALSNTVFIGFPVLEILMGPAVLADGIVHYLANTLWFWTLGVALLRQQPGQRATFSAAGLKKLASPALVALALALLLKALGLGLPFVLLYPLETIGKTATGVSLLFIGTVIRRTPLRSLRLTRELLFILVGRFVLAPLCALCVGRLLPVSVQMRQVVFILSMMPAMTQLGIMSKESGSDYAFASVAVTVTTLLSLVFIPLYALLMEHVPLFA